MKQDGLSKAESLAGSKGNAADGFATIPETPMGPPETTGAPEDAGAETALSAIDLPVIDTTNLPDPFPIDEDNPGGADDILDFLF